MGDGAQGRICQSRGSGRSLGSAAVRHEARIARSPPFPPVGIVAAAGTGAQETACLLDAAGGGVSHIIGVGGRDLSSDVGGLMLREGMRLLASDDATETLLLVSKPPAPEVVAALAEAVPDGVRVVAAFVGW